MTPPPAAATSARAPGRRLLRALVRQHARAFLGASVATVLIAVAELAMPWPLKWVIDEVIDGRDAPFALQAADMQMLALLALATVGITALSAVGSYTGDLWLKIAGERIAHQLRIATYAHLQRLSLAFHDRRQKGDLVTHLTDDANRVGEVFADSLGAMAQALLMICGMAAVSFWLDPLLGAVFIAFVPVLALVTLHYRRKVRAMARRQRDRDGRIASLAAESLSAMRLVQSSGSEIFEHDRVRETSEERQRYGAQVAALEARFAGWVDVIGAVAMAAVLVIGAVRVSTGVISAGTIVVFGQYARRLYRPLKDIAKNATRISRGMARLERIAEVLAADDVLAERPDAYAGPRVAGRVRLEQVTFHYDSERPVLDGLDLDIAAGSRVALVGRSGEGKSTVGALVVRFYDPTSGRVTLDGRDLRDCSLRWVRQQVGVVLQDTVLLTGTVAENIAYGTDASREAIIAAAKAADAHAFVMSLPRGYDEPLGPQGVGLSGGQRQRLGIARVLLRDPAVLVLDEPTTGLDAASEWAVMRSLERLMRGRTVLLVTHSMALARACDRVVVLDGGRIRQDGTPADLLARTGLFRTLAREQGIAGTVGAAAVPGESRLAAGGA